MQKKKIATWLLATLCVGALSFGAACGESGATSGGENSENSVESSSVADSSVLDSSIAGEISEEIEYSKEIFESSEEVENSEEIIGSSKEAEDSEEVIESSEWIESSEKHICVWGDWYVFTPAGCETVGEERRDCANCDEYETREIPSQGHNFTDYILDENASCEEDGTKTAICGNGCGKTDTVIVEGSVKGHEYTQLKYDDVQHWYECKWCADVDSTSKENHYGGTATTTEQAKCTVCGQEYGELMIPDTPEIPETYERLSDGTINFGAYPQMKVTDVTLTTALTSAAGALPTASNSQGWTSYKYYISSSNDTDYMWYQDVVYGGNIYRGVYFTSYRPYSTRYSSVTSYIYQDDNGYIKSTVYWFAYEVLNWIVLEENNGEAFLLCNSIIDCQEYYHNSTEIRTINGVSIYPNNYAESNIRKWLNETFYKTAFTSLQQSLIKVTKVDNGAKSTNPYGKPAKWNSGVNKYACANTNDKIFLLSEEEATNPNYGFSSDQDDNGIKSARIRKTSDYAQSQGCYTKTSSSSLGNGWWRLRSPYYDHYYDARHIYIDGNTNYFGDVNVTSGGVVPALKLSL